MDEKINMKKLIILSDTHKNQKMLRKVFQIEKEYSHIFHLGDDYEDMNDNSDITDNVELIRVPGLYHPGYKDRSIPAILEIEIDNWKFALAHRLEDLLKTTISADIYLYGHTHHFNFDHIDDKYFINPGHLTARRDRDRNASYVVMVINKDNAEIQFKYLDGEVFNKKQINKL